MTHDLSDNRTTALTTTDRSALALRTRQVHAHAPGAEAALLALVDELVSRHRTEAASEARDVARLEAIAAVESVAWSAPRVRMAS